MKRTEPNSQQRNARMEVKRQTKVGAGIDQLWKCLSKDLCAVLPKVMPSFVESAEVVEGDGGLDTVFLFTFGSGVPGMRYQKEKIVLLDESMHRIGLQVIEGGHLHRGFCYYRASFQLTATAQEETAVDVLVEYEVEGEDGVETSLPLKTMSSALAFIERLTDYLIREAAQPRM